jgi:CBS domain-containing protein
MTTAEDMLNEKKGPIFSVGPDATVREALDVMAEHGIGSILVMEGDRLVGIWTERDLIKQSVVADFSMDETRMHACMVTTLEYTPSSDSVLQLMDKIVGRRQRRLLIQREEAFLGLLTSGDVMRACLQEKTKEIQGLNAMVGWEYYEDWRWAPGKSRLQ